MGGSNYGVLCVGICEDTERSPLLSRLVLAMKNNSPFVVQIATTIWEKAIDYTTTKKLESLLPCLISGRSKEVSSNTCTGPPCFLSPTSRDLHTLPQFRPLSLC